MSIVWTAALAWLGWNVVGPILIGIVAIAVFAIFSIPGAIRRARCQHLRFYETSACDAICCDCGKNLGFIDNARRRVNPGPPGDGASRTAFLDAKDRR